MKYKFGFWLKVLPMMLFGIDRFAGSWIDSPGYRLEIKRLDNRQATVDFFDPSGTPVIRPYMNGAPSLGMAARYDDYYGSFEVDLWGAESGYILDLLHENAYALDLDEKRREALIPSLSRNETDHFLDEFNHLFGGLEHFVRIGSR